MSWDDTTKIMTAPIEWNSDGDGDLQVAAGVESSDLKTCIVNGSWNKWAKWKPVKDSKIAPLTAEEMKAKNYGLTITPCGPNGDVSTFVSNFSSRWAYNKPDGSTGEMYRVFDLTNPSNPSSSTGYRGNANCFIDLNNCIFPSSYYLNQGGTGVTFQLGVNTGNNIKEGSITPADLRFGDSSTGTAFSAMYFGLLFKTGTTYKLITAPYAMSGYPREGASYPEITLEESSSTHTLPVESNTTYSVYPVLSVSSHTSLTTFANTDVIIALPVSAFTFKASEPAATQTMSVQILQAYLNHSARPTIKFKARYDKTGSAAETISDGTYEIHNAASDGDTTGTLWGSGSINGTSSMTYATWYTVGPSTFNVSNSGWVYVKVYRGNASSVYDEAWAMISETEPEIE